MLEQVSLLSNKTWHSRSVWNPVGRLLGVTPRKVNHLRIEIHWRKLRFDKVNNNVRLKIVRDARVSAKSIQVQVG